MASTYLFSDAASGMNFYFRIWNTAHEVFDFNDNTFKAIGSATTPQILATFSTASDLYRSNSTVNWANVWNKGTPTDFIVEGYNNATPAAADAPVTNALVYTVQFGEIGAGVLSCMLGATMTSSAGTEVRLLAWLERNGQRIALAAGSCTVTVREHGAGSDLFTVTDAAPNADGVFELTKASPAFTDDRLYKAKVEITENSTTWTSYHDLSVFG